jgi:hypothetical protein
MPAAFEAAMLESPRGDERTRLVGDLIGCFFSAYASVAAVAAAARAKRLSASMTGFPSCPAMPVISATTA